MSQNLIFVGSCPQCYNYTLNYIQHGFENYEVFCTSEQCGFKCLTGLESENRCNIGKTFRCSKGIDSTLCGFIEVELEKRR